MKVYDKTSVFSSMEGVKIYPRSYEIKEYLNTHHIESYAIIDDAYFGWGDLVSNFIRTNPDNGLTKTTVKDAISLLNKQ